MRVEPADVGSAESVALLTAYFTDVVSRFHRRPATNDEVAAVMADETSERLMPPDGTFLVARGEDGNVVGCIGLRSIGPAVGEIKRMFVRPEARGAGVGSALLVAAEQEAARRGWTELRLDTHSELVEARALYEARGFAEIERYNANPYAHHWYAKRLDT
jgi:GNAT superfamily N-acetyltransferase